MFPLNQNFESSFRGRQVDRLAREVAERSLEPARERLSRTVWAMSPAELRGYVRARATRPVRVHARQALAHHRMQDTLLDDLVQSVLERTVHLLVREFLVQPVVAMPAAHVRLRAAA